jgi:hypothetical protein
MRLANIGIGHGTIDSGGAYTYLNPASGNEFSATAGFTFGSDSIRTEKASSSSRDFPSA